MGDNRGSMDTERFDRVVAIAWSAPWVPAPEDVDDDDDDDDNGLIERVVRAPPMPTLEADDDDDDDVNILAALAAAAIGGDAGVPLAVALISLAKVEYRVDGRPALSTGAASAVAADRRLGAPAMRPPRHRRSAGELRSMPVIGDIGSRSAMRCCA